MYLQGTATLGGLLPCMQLAECYYFTEDRINRLCRTVSEENMHALCLSLIVRGHSSAVLVCDSGSFLVLRCTKEVMRTYWKGDGMPLGKSSQVRACTNGNRFRSVGQ